MPRRSSAPTAVGVYIFAGGFTLGVRRAGFNVLAQLEDGEFGVATTRLNHPELPVYTRIPDWPLDELKGVGFMYGNPPCAPWSTSGISHRVKGAAFKTKYERDPRTSCVYTMFDALTRARPTVWAWESVTPALTRGRPLVEELTAAAAELGYSATYVLLNAVDIGLPQSRYRFFCVFHKVEIPWEYPRVERPMTVWDAIGDHWPDYADHYPLSTAFQELMPNVVPGEGLQGAWERQHPPEQRRRNARGHVIGRPAFTQLRLEWDRPAPTMIGGAHMFHPEEDRALSYQEAALLCGYPPGYEFVGRLGDRYCQIARAVMPPVGEWLAGNVKRALEGNRRLRRPRTWLRNFHKNRHYEVTTERPPTIR